MSPGSGSCLNWLPRPLRAARLTEAKITRLLQQYRIRRIAAAEVRTVLKTKPLTLAPPGAAEAAAEHAPLLLPQLRLLHPQRTDPVRRIGPPTGRTGRTGRRFVRAP